MTFFPELTPRFKDVIAELEGHPLAILGHLRPDGDCIGSQIALARVLAARGFDTVCVNKHLAPRVLAGFLDNTPYLEAKKFSDAKRVPLACDAADRERLGEELNALYAEIFLCVDHHISNDGYAKHNLIDPAAAATAEILAGIFFDLDYPIDPVTAQALYIGIATDTGQFQYGGTTRRVFQLAGRLVESGAEPAAASQALYEQESFEKMQLLQRFLASMTRCAQERACIGFIRSKDYIETGATYEDTEGFVNYARSLQGVDIGVILEERGNSLKGSLRAKDAVMRVDKLASSLGGGGHACAAGFSIKDQTIDSFSSTFLDMLQSHLNNPDNAPA